MGALVIPNSKVRMTDWLLAPAANNTGGTLAPPQQYFSNSFLFISVLSSVIQIKTVLYFVLLYMGCCNMFIYNVKYNIIRGVTKIKVLSTNIFLFDVKFSIETFLFND